MTMTVQEQKNATVSLLRILHEDVGINVIAAGGCVRDWDHGRPAKDVDLCVLDSDASDADSFEDAAQEMAGYLKPFVDDHEVKVYSTYRDCPGGRLDYVLKFKYLGLDFDLISYGSCPSTGEDQVDEFDANINAIFAEFRAGPEPEDDFLGIVCTEKYRQVRLGLEPIRPMRHLDGDPAKRIAYLGEKYPQYKTSLEVI